MDEFGGLVRGSELFGWGVPTWGAGLVCEPRDGRDEGGSRGGRAVEVLPGGVPRGVGGPSGWAVRSSSCVQCL